MVQIINTMLTVGPAVRPVVTQNKSTNSIVVRATAPVMGVIQNIIDSNDKPRAEVMVDVQILEVSRIRLKELGLDLSNWQLGFTFSPELSPPNTSGTFPPAVPPPFNMNTISRGISPADFYMTVPTAVIKALATDTRTKLLANPQLRGREGAQLTLNLGDQVPYPVTSFVPVAAGGVPTTPQISYQYRPVGVNLTITPRVTYQDEIILDPIIVDKSGLGANVDVAGQSIPSFVNRTASVSMRLRNGESNLLAGLIREEERETARSLARHREHPHPAVDLRQHGHEQGLERSRDDRDAAHHPVSRNPAADLKPFYIGTGQNFGAGSTPTLISPDARPAAAARGAGTGDRRDAARRGRAAGRTDPAAARGRGRRATAHRGWGATRGNARAAASRADSAGG